MKKITKGSGLRRVLASCNKTSKNAGDVSDSLTWLESKKGTDPLAAYVLALSRVLTVDFDALEANAVGLSMTVEREQVSA